MIKNILIVLLLAALAFTTKDVWLADSFKSGPLDEYDVIPADVLEAGKEMGAPIETCENRNDLYLDFNMFLIKISEYMCGTELVEVNTYFDLKDYYQCVSDSLNAYWKDAEVCKSSE